MTQDWTKSPEYLALTGQISAGEYLAMYGDKRGEVQRIPDGFGEGARKRSEAKKVETTASLRIQDGAGI
jgi:hypothetical protein